MGTLLGLGRCSGACYAKMGLELQPGQGGQRAWPREGACGEHLCELSDVLGGAWDSGGGPYRVLGTRGTLKQCQRLETRMHGLGAREVCVSKALAPTVPKACV